MSLKSYSVVLKQFQARISLKGVFKRSRSSLTEYIPLPLPSILANNWDGHTQMQTDRQKCAHLNLETPGCFKFWAFERLVKFSKHEDWSKSQIVNISAYNLKMKKVRPLNFLNLLKFQKMKNLFPFGLHTEILTISAFNQSTRLTEITCK